MSDRDQVIALLTQLVDINRAILAALRTGAPAPSPATAAVADARDLDSQYGNPVVRGKDPRDWHGPTMKGRHFSECPADYLDLLAASLDWQGDQAAKKHEMTNGGKPVADYRRKDAARARGWAARVRAGAVPQGTHEPRYEPDPEFAAAGFEASDFTPSNWNR